MMRDIPIYRSVAHLSGIDLFYMDTKTNGPAILCLHGLHGRAETWHDFIQRYGNRYRIIAPDQRGHGLSGKPVSRYTVEEFAEDAQQLLRHLSIDSAIVIGHSMGGKVAGYMAALYAEIVKAAALLDISAAGPDKPALVPLEQIPHQIPLTKDWPMPFSSLHQARRYIAEAAESELSYDYYMNSLFETVEGYRMQFSTQAIAAYYAHKENWYHILQQIQCPVLLVRAQGNEGIADEDYAAMQSALRNVQAREMSHPDHNVHLSDQALFYAYVDEWMETL